MQPLDSIEALIIDMDGVLWHGNRPQHGIDVFFAGLRELGLPFVLATNNASQTPDDYVSKLAGFGVEVALDEILTSGSATAVYLAMQYEPAQTRVFAIGSSGLLGPLQEQGFILTDLYAKEVDLVVCGLDRQLNWDKLATACYALQEGAGFFASNGDTSLPTERGFSPGNGAVLAAIKAATGYEPIIIGKPESVLYQQALQRLGKSAAVTVAIGDRLDTDILGATRTGIRSMLVLSGISTEADLRSVDYQPTWVYRDILEIYESLLVRRQG